MIPRAGRVSLPPLQQPPCSQNKQCDGRRDGPRDRGMEEEYRMLLATSANRWSPPSLRPRSRVTTVSTVSGARHPDLIDRPLPRSPPHVDQVSRPLPPPPDWSRPLGRLLRLQRAKAVKHRHLQTVPVVAGMFICFSARAKAKLTVDTRPLCHSQASG